MPDRAVGQAESHSKASVRLPEKVDVAIIGGGIAGISTAMDLIEKGVSVAVFEKGRVGQEQSGRNWGWCRKMGRDPAEVPLSKIALDIWAGMDARIGASTGFVPCGVAYLCENEGQMTKREAWFHEQAVPHGLSTRLLNATQARELARPSGISWVGGLFTPDDGRAEPERAVPAMAAYLQRQGVPIVENCAVRTLDRQTGAVSGLVTEHGRVRASSVVLAGGIWSHKFLRNEGVFLPQLTVLNSVMQTAPVTSPRRVSLSGGGVAIRRRADGGFTVGNGVYSQADVVPDYLRLAPSFLPGFLRNREELRLRIGKRFFCALREGTRWSGDDISPFERNRVFDPKPSRTMMRETLASLTRAFPEFQGIEIVRSWAGGIDVVPDAVPVIDAIDAVPGLYVATGLSGHGFGLGPGVGKLMAEHVTGEPTCVDPTPFRIARFRRFAIAL